MSNEFSIYLKKYLPLGSKYAPGVLLLFLSIFLSVYFRLGLVDLKATEEYAKNSIENEIYQQSVQEIDTQYPFLPSANKQDLIKKQISELITGNWVMRYTEIGTKGIQLLKSTRSL